MKKQAIRHGEWLITSFGLEHKDGRYDIAKSRLIETRLVQGKRVAAWPIQMTEKAWCQGSQWQSFFVAFQKALKHHKLPQTGAFSPSELIWCKRYCQGQMEAGKKWERSFTAWLAKNRPERAKLTGLASSTYSLSDFREFEKERA